MVEKNHGDVKRGGDRLKFVIALVVIALTVWLVQNPWVRLVVLGGTEWRSAGTFDGSTAERVIIRRHTDGSGFHIEVYRMSVWGSLRETYFFTLHGQWRGTWADEAYCGQPRVFFEFTPQGKRIENSSKVENLSASVMRYHEEAMKEVLKRKGWWIFF